MLANGGGNKRPRAMTFASEMPSIGLQFAKTVAAIALKRTEQ